VIYWDGSWVPFLHELSFDTDLYSPASCNGGSTQYGGVMEFGLYHIDNAPAGAKGFQETRDWQLVNCDRNANGRFDNGDRDLTPGGFDQLEVLNPVTKDVVTACTTGNCQDEIVTTLEVVLDNDCNGVIDPVYPEFVCFYAEARVPTTADRPYWQTPLQARISSRGGDKTVNFSAFGPTALYLLAFGASSPAGSSNLMLVLAGGLILVGFALFAISTRRMRRVRNVFRFE